MAKKKNENSENAIGTPGPDMPENTGSIDRLPVTIHTQYIKDLSFENPNAPTPLRAMDGKPTLDVDFAMDAQKIEMPDFKDTYEVVLSVAVHARKGATTTFMIELQYGMAVSLTDVPQDKIHPLLLIEMPSYMFPYVRQIVSDLTAHAGYMPFYLTPVNFKALYRKRFGGPQVNEPAKEKEAQSA